jgi:hypothetical protein
MIGDEETYKHTKGEEIVDSSKNVVSQLNFNFILGEGNIRLEPKII